MDPTTKELPPEALLIRRARQSLGLSPERAVQRLERITMTGRNWRKIEEGRYVPDDTLAHMAHAMEVTPRQLAAARRGEAAAIVEEIQRRQATRVGADERLRELLDEFADDTPIREMLLAVQRTRELRRQAADPDKSPDTGEKRAG